MNSKAVGVNETNDISIKGGQFEPQLSEAVGTYNAPIFSHSTPPFPSSSKTALIGFVIISQIIWNEVITRLTTLEKKVWLVEEGVQPWVENKLEEQSRKIQRRLYSFEWRVTCQLGSRQTPDISEVKAEIAELWKLVNELHERSVFPRPIIMKVQPEVEIKNIWSIPVGEDRGKKKRTRKEKEKAPRIKILRQWYETAS